MQERQGDAFVIATANDVSTLPPELLRKGRFDEVWWVDLPTMMERTEIIAASLRFHGRDAGEIDTMAVAAACDSYTGAEIAALVPDALYVAFADDEREIETRDLLAAAKTVTPLAKTAKEKIDRLREWAVGRARPATSAEVTSIAPAPARVRALDI